MKATKDGGRKEERRGEEEREEWLGGSSSSPPPLCLLPPSNPPVEEALPRGGDKGRGAARPILNPGRSDTRFVLVSSSQIQEIKDCFHIFIHVSTL